MDGWTRFIFMNLSEAQLGLFDVQMKGSSGLVEVYQSKKGTPLAELDFLVSARSLVEKVGDEIPWLIEDLIPKGAIVMLGGESTAGKSSMAKEFCLRLLNGDEEVLGKKLNPMFKSILYVSSEDGEYPTGIVIKNQIKAVAGFEVASLDALHLIFDTHKINVKISAALNAMPVDLIVIDSMGDFLSGNMNQTNTVRSDLDFYSKIINRYPNTSVLFVHHTGKGKEANLPSKNNFLGSQGIEAKMRVVMELKKGKEDLRSLHIVKSNYSSDPKISDPIFMRMTQFQTYELSEPFELRSEKKKDDRIEKIAIAKQLKGQGLTLNEISNEMTSRGYADCGKSAIGNWLKQ